MKKALKNIIRSFLCFIVLMACNENTSTEEIPADKLSGVRVILTLKDSVFASDLDVFVNALVLNNDTTDYKVPNHIISNPILALRVFDEQNNPMYPIPPATPPLEKDINWIIVKTGEALRLTYDLNMFSSPLPNGNYWVEMNNMVSNKVSFRIDSAIKSERID